MSSAASKRTVTVPNQITPSMGEGSEGSSVPHAAFPDGALEQCDSLKVRRHDVALSQAFLQIEKAEWNRHCKTQKPSLRQDSSWDFQS